jgi:hypothetical protein
MIAKSKKGDMTMTYNKPEIVLLASAVSAVKGQNKDDNVQLDGGVFTLSINAYESDE